MKIHRPHFFNEIKRHRRELRDINRELRAENGPLIRMSVWITNHVGTVEFFLLTVVWTAAWLIWNSVAPARMQFDSLKSGFILWLFVSNLIQLFLMPLILVGQNIQARHAEAVAQSDLEINIKAEKEVDIILHHLDHLDKMLVIALEKLGVDMADVIEHVDHPDHFTPAGQGVTR